MKQLPEVVRINWKANNTQLVNVAYNEYAVVSREAWNSLKPKRALHLINCASWEGARCTCGVSPHA